MVDNHCSGNESSVVITTLLFLTTPTSATCRRQFADVPAGSDVTDFRCLMCTYIGRTLLVTSMEVAQYRAWSVIRWVTIRRYTAWYATSHLSQFIHLPSAGCETSTIQGVVAVYCGLEGNNKSGVVPAMHQRLQYIHLMAQRLKNGK